MTGRSGHLPPPVQLAYIGDAVWELHVRAAVVGRRPGTMDDIHRRSVTQVRASIQARTWRAIEPFLQDDELAVARRARNAKLTPPRGVSRGDYAQSTSFESVLGFLFWTGNIERLREVMERADAFLQGQGD